MLEVSKQYVAQTDTLTEIWIPIRTETDGKVILGRREFWTGSIG
jgi:hypothetical protein